MSKMFSIFLIAAFGGLLAYVGDKIGLKIGKNKLSIFGLRPKITGIFITITTGIIISALTLLFLSIASENVRIALFKMDELKHEIITSRTQLNESNLELSKSKESFLESQDMLFTLKNEYSLIKREYEDIQTERNEALKEADILSKQIATLRANETSLKEEINSLDRTKEELGKEITDLNLTVKDLSYTQKNLSSDVDMYRMNKIMLEANETLVSIRVEQMPIINFEEALNSEISAQESLLAEKYGVNQVKVVIDEYSLKKAKEEFLKSSGECIITFISKYNVLVGENPYIIIAVSDS